MSAIIEAQAASAVAAARNYLANCFDEADDIAVAYDLPAGNVLMEVREILMSESLSPAEARLLAEVEKALNAQ